MYNKQEYPHNLAEALNRHRFFSSPEIKITTKEQMEGLNAAIGTLLPVERCVICMRFRQNLTLRQAGEKIGKTQERIRQIEARAIRRLSYPSRLGLICMGKEGFAVVLEQKAAEEQKRAEEKERELVEQYGPSDFFVQNAGLSTRTYNVLARHGIISLLQIKSERQLRAIRGCGDSTVKEVHDFLMEHGIQLPQKVESPAKKHPFADVELSTRTRNALARRGFCSLSEIQSKKQLKRVRGLGKQSVQEICDLLAKQGIVLPEK